MSAPANIEWVAESLAGPLEITINRAKPEKDPRAIAAAAGGEGAAACPLCWTADGGRAHLVVSGDSVTPVVLGGEEWAWWFSPYGYFPEHLIVSSPDHRPMAITHDTIGRLLDFADAYPRWFIGSNAELPIVGGSLLSHDHFQGGGHRFPLMNAPVERAFELPGLPQVQAGIVRWPASVARLRSTRREAVREGACRVLDAWRLFSDEECGIVAFTEAPDKTGRPGGRPYDGPPAVASVPSTEATPVGPTSWSPSQPGTDTQPAPIPHNTLNPILWREGDDYVCDLVLRNNRTTPEHPYGLFHVPERLFHIKKENIGLIEIMGRAILPGRLAAEYPAVRPACDAAFYEILQATGVFKQTPEGHAGWHRFIATL